MVFSTFTSTICGKETPGKSFTVVIDAGHGGKDMGAVDNNVKEKDINLGVALQLRKLIEKHLKDTKVVMTRENDTYLTLQQRADVANKAKGDLFISIHTNSVDKSNKNRKTVAGSSVYALGLHKDDNNMAVARRENSVIELESDYAQKYSGFDPSKDESYIIFEMAQKKNLNKSIKFADMAQKELVKSGRNNRGVHQAGFWVLWATSMPAVLVELDFICNPTAAKYLSSEKGAKELAEALFKAIEQYEKDWRSNSMTSSLVPQEASSSPRKDTGDAKSAPKVIASSKVDSRKVEKAPATKPSNYASARRRRRSDKAKESSAARNLETEAIPLHSSMERIGKKAVEEKAVAAADVSKPESASTSPKQKEKNKKDKKKGKETVKQVKKKEPPENSHNAKVEKFVTVYKIQVLASSELLKENDPRFKGLHPITAVKDKNLYKYYYGESESSKTMNDLLKEVRTKIPDAFIVSGTKVKSSVKK